MAEVPAELTPATADSARPPATLANLPGGALLVGLSRQPATRQIGLLMALAASVALGVGIVFWMQDPEMRPIAGSSDPEQALRITQTLTEQGIPFQVSASTGLISVPAQRFHAAQMQLATTMGVDGDQLGYELLDRDQGFGISQFMEESNLRRGLEGELARSIATIQAVESARVLLAVPRKSGFLRDRREPSASVTLRLFSGARLDGDAALGIAKLVAGAVPELTPERVTVVDSQGRLLSRPDDPTRSASDWQLAYVQRMEQSYQEKVRNLLLPVLGADGFIAEVAARVDFTATEQTEELYNSDLPALRSEQVLDETRTGVPDPEGVPGALTNQPPAVAAAPEVGGEAAGDAVAGARAERTRAEALRNYELDRTISHTRGMLGVVERLTVSVMVADRQTVAEDGTATPTPWTAEDLDGLAAAIRSAVGFDASRGDVVTVTNRAFQAVQEVPLGATPFYAEEWFQALTRQALGALGVLMVVFLLLRPMLKNLLEAGQPETEQAGNAEDDLFIPAEGLPAEQLPPGLPAPEEEEHAALALESYQTKLDTVRTLVAEDPARVVQVVKHWVADE